MNFNEVLAYLNRHAEGIRPLPFESHEGPEVGLQEPKDTQVQGCVWHVGQVLGRKSRNKDGLHQAVNQSTVFEDSGQKEVDTRILGFTHKNRT